MPGRLVQLTWASDPTIYAPPKYKRACGYEAFVPDPITAMPLSLDAGIAGLVSEAENAIRNLNDKARPALAPMARLLLRTESIASSKVEGMQLGVGEIIAIHQRLMERAENRSVAGKIRTRQNWIGGNDYNPCGADFVPPPPAHVSALLDDLCEAINDDRLPPIVQAALVHAQFETI